MHKYYLEFILNIPVAVPMETLRNSLVEFGENLEISQALRDNDIKGEDFKVCIYTDDPTIIFDTCAQFGKMKSIKIDEKH